MPFIIKLFELFFNLLESALKFLFEFSEFAVSNIPKRKEGYNATFAPASTVLSSSYRGFCITGTQNLSVKNSYQNALVCGGTGTGKSSVVLLPSLFTMDGSFIVHDPSGELFVKSAGYLQQKGYEVKTLNFSNPDISSGYNPLHRANSSSEIQKVASMLVENALGGKSKDPFWNTQSVALLSILVTILKKQPKEYHNLYNVRLLLNAMGANPKAVDKLFSRDAEDRLFDEYKSFLAYDDKVINGVIATCKASLQIFSDDAVAKVTSYDNIDFDSFRKYPTALFIQNSVADQRYYSVLTSIFFEQFFSYIMSRFPGEEERDIFLLIDEAASLKLPTLSVAVANVRKHRAGILLIVQDYNQVIHNYGKQEAEAIRSNCFAKVFFTGQGLETAKELEQVLGKYEYKDKEEGKKVVRSMMTNDEIRTMKNTRALLICGHHQPIVVKLKPYYQDKKKRSFSRFSPPQAGNRLPFEELPTLPLYDR